MKTSKIITTLFLAGSIFLLSCGNSSSNKTIAADTTTNQKKADTSIVATGQKSVKDDSVSGDPSSKGAADPNAKLPKK